MQIAHGRGKGGQGDGRDKVTRANRSKHGQDMLTQCNIELSHVATKPADRARGVPVDGVRRLRREVATQGPSGNIVTTCRCQLKGDVPRGPKLAFWLIAFVIRHVLKLPELRSCPQAIT